MLSGIADTVAAVERKAAVWSAMRTPLLPASAAGEVAEGFGEFADVS